MVDNIGHDDETSPLSPCQLVMKDKFIRQVCSTRKSIYSDSSNQDEERDRILNILKLGHELRDGEKTTKQKYYWKQDDARNIKVIHAQLFLICQHAIIHCFRYTYFSTAINCSLRSGMIRASFRSVFFVGKNFHL